MNNKKILLICLSILTIAVVITVVIFSTEPTAESEAATKETAMLVEVVTVERGNYNPVLVATGIVEPVEDVMLSPLVSGQIIRRSPSFIPGGFVQKGEILLQIDPSDYKNALELQKSELLQTQTDLEMEMGRQKVALQDLKLAGVDSLTAEEQALVLRQPQLEAVKATVQGSRASVQQAQLNLERTNIRAPFDAHILSQNVTVGGQVAPGDDLGRLVGSEFYWVKISLPMRKLRWLHFPSSEEEEGSAVKIKNPSVWSEDQFREGYLYRRVGALEDQTRMAQIIARVPDPLGFINPEKELPELLIGSFVEVQVKGTQIKDVVRLDRDYLRTNQTVWVMEDGKLSIRKVDVVLTDANHAYIRKGIEHGDQVITTNLSTVAEGIELRTEE